MAKVVNERADAVAALGEVFREYGFDGASLSVIARRTGLGKGSLYHFFPGGKEEMAAAVLENIDTWFETQVYAPLRTAPDPRAAVLDMFVNVSGYFRSGGRVCLVGVFALGDVRDRFAARIHGYFEAWRDALADALGRMGHGGDVAAALAEDTLAAIQGALVLSRALDTATFQRVIDGQKKRLLAGAP